MSRKLRGLRGKSGASIVNDEGSSDRYSPDRSMQDRDDKTGSSRSFNDSHGSIGDDSYYEETSFAGDSYAMPCNLKTTTNSTNSFVPGSSPRELERRGAAARGMMPMLSSSTNHSLMGASEHSTTSLSSTGSQGLGNGTRGRSRGLGNKKISTFRITEPGSAPMVSSLGTVAPLAGSSHSSSSRSTSNSNTPQRTNRLEQRGFAAIPRPAVPDGNHPSSVAPCSVANSLNVLLSINENSTSQASSNHPNNNGGRMEARSEPTISRQPVMMGSSNHTSEVLTAMVTPGAAVAQAPARTTPAVQAPARAIPAPAPVEVPAPIPAPPAAPAAAPASATRRAVPDIVREAQELSEKVYQPTEEDWANLYKKHVEVLERKDIEIARRLSSRGQAGVYDHRRTPRGDEDNGLSLALQASRNETQPIDEEKMLQMVLEMSRNEEPSSTTEAPQRALTEEEELARVLRLSEQDAGQQQQQQPLSEQEELEQILRLSEMEQGPTDEDEELLRILQMSQKEAADQQKERETMELVLRLSQQQGADGLW